MGLSISSGTLRPVFATQETYYRVSVANAVSQVTIIPELSNPSAKVSFTDESAISLTDADVNADGQQVELIEGENTINVGVVSGDGQATRTYTLVVIRDNPANVCTRTPQVRDAIVAAVEGVDQCNEVTGAHLEEITRLSLFNQRIKKIQPGDFAGLTKLESLSLAGNRLSAIPAGVFSELSALTNLDLSQNEFTNLSTDAFSGLSSLEGLYLGYNRLSSLPDDIFSGMSEIEWISLGRNRFTELPVNLFSGLSRLKIIDLHSNRFKRLTPGLFYGLTGLRELYLGGNNLTTLAAQDFLDLSQLRVLRLAGNLLGNLPPGVFSSLPKLNRLDLSGNSLKSLPPGVFSGLTALEELDLEDNLAESLPLSLSLEKIRDSQFKAIAPAGAPFTLVLPVNISRAGEIADGATSVTLPAGSIESSPLRVTRVAGSEAAVIVDIGILPGRPENHRGYVLARDRGLAT